MIYKGQKLSDNLTKSQRDMFKYMIDRGDSIEEIIKIYTQPEPKQVEEFKEECLRNIGVNVVNEYNEE